MQRRMLLTSLWGGLLLCLMACGPHWTAAQEDESAASARATRVRLPAYFAAVVTPMQRQEVYQIQLKYLEQIEALQQQIAELEKERDKAVDEVLTAEQLAEVQKRREAAAERRRARAAEREDAAAEAP